MTEKPTASDVVVDASAVVKWLANEPDSESAADVVVDAGRLTAPDLLPAEVANAFWKKVRRGDMPMADIEPAITNLLALGIELHHSTGLLNRAVQIALEKGHPVYDCLYLALAADSGMPLVTADRRLQQAALDLGISLWRSASSRREK